MVMRKVHSCPAISQTVEHRHIHRLESIRGTAIPSAPEESVDKTNTPISTDKLQCEVTGVVKPLLPYEVAGVVKPFLPIPGDVFDALTNGVCAEDWCELELWPCIARICGRALVSLVCHKLVTEISGVIEHIHLH